MTKKLRTIAVVGFGYWGQKLAAASVAAGLRVVIVDSVTLSQTVYRQMSWQAVLKNAEISGVIIATPEKTHAELARAALNANKAVLLEKPATTAAESWQMCVDLATEKTLPLLVDYTFLHSEAFELWRTLEQNYASELGVLERLITIRKSQLSTERIEGKALPIWWDVAIHDLYLLRALYATAPINWKLEPGALPSQIKATADFNEAQLVADYSWLAKSPERSWLAEYEFGELLWRRVAGGEFFEVLIQKKTVFSVTISDQNPSPLDMLIKNWLALWGKKNLVKSQKKHWDAVTYDIKILARMSDDLTNQLVAYEISKTVI